MTRKKRSGLFGVGGHRTKAAQYSNNKHPNHNPATAAGESLGNVGLAFLEALYGAKREPEIDEVDERAKGSVK